MELIHPSPTGWNTQIAALPGANLLQTWEWGQVKAQGGWDPYPAVWKGAGGSIQAAALILRRTVRLGGFAAPLRILYVPRGPLLDWSRADLRRQVLEDLQRFARRQGAIFIKMDPPVSLNAPDDGFSQHFPPGGELLRGEMAQQGWRFSDEQIQFRNTMAIDLRQDPDTLLSKMKQKTRYNIRLAEKKGVRVRAAGLEDLPALYHMYAETSVRDGFVIRPESYYLQVWRTFMQAGMAEPLLAEVEGSLVGGVVIFRFAGQAIYMHGMSRDLHREKMPNYLLQWEAMRRAQAAGCQVYDLWGAPDELNEADSMWGVYRFKEGLGAQLVQTIGAWDWPVNTLFYRFYTQALPKLLDVMRRRGRARTQREVLSG